jgi:ribosomal protein S18 acetylase RimI-like enzyme
MPDLIWVPPGESREEHVPLLLLADEAEDHVRAHLDEGELFTFVDGEDTTGAVQAVPRGDHVELTLVAVTETHQGRGIGKAMLAAVLDRLRELGHGRVVVGTSNAGVGEIAYYQKVGFRLARIERDYFNEARGYDGTASENGIVHRDMVWLDLDLA